jgi:tetratricopeptide (TPR) repeat protein
MLNRPYVHVLIIIFLALACYSNTFHVPMLLDDEGSIQLHTPVHGLANYLKDWAGYNFLPNRAFGYLTFALNYEFGGLNLPGYHLVNLAIHISTGLLVYALVRLTFRTPYLHVSDDDSPQVRVFAFVVALFFVCHPIQTQAVTYIVQRLTSMTAMFYIAALVCYVRWRLPRTGSAPTTAGKGLVWYSLSLASIILAMKTKEISFTLPVVILLYECSFFGFPGWNLLAKMSPLLMTIVLIPVTRILQVAPLVQSAGGVLSDSHSPSYGIVRMTRWDYLYTQFSVIVTYLRLLFFPVNQNLDYDYPISRALLEPRTFLSLLLLLAIFMLAIYMFAKSRQTSTQPDQGDQTTDSLPFAQPQLLLLAAFGIFWFFITLSVESSIIKIQDVIYEHWVYLPSFGFFLSVTALAMLLLVRLQNRFRWLPNATAAVTGCIVLILSVASYNRNHVWRDWITLWSDNVAKSPAKPRPHNILGIGYFYRGNFDLAMREYREAVRLKPDFIEAYYNMGLIHKARKEYKDAILMYLRVLGISAFNAEQFAKTYNEIGINYAELKNPDEAIKAFGTAVKYMPESVEYRNNYAYALWMNGRLDDALSEYLSVLRSDPRNGYAIAAVQEIRASIRKQ